MTTKLSAAAPSRFDVQPQPSDLSLFKLALACLIGNGIELYDFALFGLLAPLLGRLFFPVEDASAQLLSTFAVFAIGFAMRPLGGILFGHIGDTLGRKQALLLSLGLMAGPTLVIGLLPTYATIGLAAPLLLTALRLLQGISLGGEYIGALAYLLEHAPEGRRAFYCSWPFCGGLLGLLLATITGAALSYYFDEATLLAGAWRLPFLMSVIPAMLGYGLRRSMHESPAYLSMMHAAHTNNRPLWTALNENWRSIIQLMAMVVPFTVSTYALFVFTPSYLIVERGFSFYQVQALNALSLLLALLLNPASGLLADLIQWRRQYLCATLPLMVCAIPLFAMIAHGALWQMITALALWTLLQTLGGAALAGALPHAFPTTVRYSAAALAYNGATTLFGGLTPFICSMLAARLGSDAPGYWVATTAALGCIGAARLCSPAVNWQKKSQCGN